MPLGFQDAGLAVSREVRSHTHMNLCRFNLALNRAYFCIDDQDNNCAMHNLTKLVKSFF